METTMTSLSEIQAIEKEQRYLNDFCVHYTLYRITTPHANHFAIEIRTEEETGMQIIGQNDLHAQRVFEMLFNETVTPCTLSEILHDILLSEENKFHCQNLS